MPLELQAGMRIFIVEPASLDPTVEQRHHSNVIKSIDKRDGSVELAKSYPEWLRPGCVIIPESELAAMN